MGDERRGAKSAIESDRAINSEYVVKGDGKAKEEKCEEGGRKGMIRLWAVD